MALNDRKITVYANPVANLPDHPSQEGFTAERLKAAFDAIANEEVKHTINGIIDDLIAKADGASGADQIGATSITDLDGTTVQAILKSIRNKLKSTIDNSSGADFIGATAISNLDGATVQAILESLRNKLKSTTDGSSGADFIDATPLKEGGATTVQGQLEELTANIATVNSNEATRVSQESARVTAENLRSSAETSRANAATSQANAESLRVTAENNRVTAEQARVDADILRGQTVKAIEQNYAPRLTSAEAQINNLDAETSKNIWTSSRGSWSARPMVSFTDDDGGTGVITKLAPIFTEKNVPLTVALYSASPILIDETSRNQLLDLQNSHNWEVVSHFNTHVDLTTLTESQLRDGNKSILKLLKGYGFNVESLFYPFGSHNNLVRSVTSEYYRSGVGSAAGTGQGNSFQVTNFYGITREGFAYDNTKTLDYYKSIVDTAISNNQWLIFISHSDVPSFDDNQRVILGQLIDYIKSLNVEIVNIRDGMNYFEPLTSAGEYNTSASTDFFNVLKSGEVISNYALTYKPLNKFTALDLRDKFINRLTIFSIDSNGVTGFPGAGTVVMIKGHIAGYDYQIWQGYADGTIQTRKTNTDGTWTVWDRLTSKTYFDANLPIQIKTLNSFLMTQLIADYPNNKITVFTNDGSNLATGVPYPSVGLITTYKVGAIAYYRQEMNVNGEIYQRFVESNGQWKSWVRVGGGQGTTAQRPATGMIGCPYFDITLGKPIWLKTPPNVWVDSTGATV